MIAALARHPAPCPSPHILSLTIALSLQSIENSIAACPVDLRRDLYKHVVLSGGSTLFQGFKERVQADLRAGATYGTTVGVVAPPDRGTSVYQGGCVVGGLSTFQNKWVTRDEYEEEGKSRVLAKCVT